MSDENGKINNYLIVYDRASGRQVSLAEFGADSDSAIARYRELERDNVRNRHMDIVLVGADSIDSIRITHASYFTEGVATLQQIEEYLSSFAAEHGVAE